MNPDQALDEALAEWAATVRLSPAEAAGIYRRIVPPPAPRAGLDPRWWREFTAEVTAFVVASTRPVQWTA
jgi:hypothetical protein